MNDKDIIGFQVQINYNGADLWVQGDYDPNEEDVNISKVEWTWERKDITPVMFALFKDEDFPYVFRMCVVHAVEDWLAEKEDERDPDYVDEDRIYEEGRDRRQSQWEEENRGK